METQQKVLEYWWCAEFRSGVALTHHEMLVSQRFPCLKQAFVDASATMRKNTINVNDGDSFIVWFENSNGVKITVEDAEQYLRVMALDSAPKSQVHRKRSSEEAEIEFPRWAKTKAPKTSNHMDIS